MTTSSGNLRPGVMALTLPHQYVSSLVVGRLVEVLSVPFIAPAYAHHSGLIVNVPICLVRYVEGRYPKPEPGTRLAYPAASLLPLGDEQEEPALPAEAVAS